MFPVTTAVAWRVYCSAVAGLCLMFQWGCTVRGQTGCGCASLVTFLHGTMDLLADHPPSVPWWNEVLLMWLVAMRWLVGWSRAVNQWCTCLHETLPCARSTESGWDHMTGDLFLRVAWFFRAMFGQGRDNSWECMLSHFYLWYVNRVFRFHFSQNLKMPTDRDTSHLRHEPHSFICTPCSIKWYWVVRQYHISKPHILVAINISLDWLVTFPHCGYLVSFTLCKLLNKRPFTRFINRRVRIKLWSAMTQTAINIKEGFNNVKEISYH